MKTSIYFLSLTVLVSYIYFVIKCKSSFKNIAKYAIGGIGSLMVVNILSGTTGVGIGVNLITVGCSTVFGTCGTILMLLIKLI